MNVVAIGSVERALLAALRDPAGIDEAIMQAGSVEAFLAAVRYHGVGPLLAERMAAAIPKHALGGQVGAQEGHVMLRAAAELAHRAELGRVLPALAQAGAPALLLKGTALAYNLYPNAALRPRGDTDLLVPLGARERAEAVLQGLGYTTDNSMQGEFVSYQRTWSCTDGLGASHCLDLHWRINNSQMLAQVLRYEELARRALAVPELGPFAYGLGRVDALLHACIHRAGHTHAPYYVDDVAHLGGDRMIWIYDIHLLLGTLSAEDWVDFVQLATSRGVKELCSDAVQTSVAYFGTVVPSTAMTSLMALGKVERSARYFSGGPMKQLLGELLALGSWRNRWRWLRENAFPDPAYMRSKYGQDAHLGLPRLYLRRLFAGAWHRLTSRGHD